MASRSRHRSSGVTPVRRRAPAHRQQHRCQPTRRRWGSGLHDQPRFPDRLVNLQLCHIYGSPVKGPSRLLHIREQIKQPLGRLVESTPRRFPGRGGDVALQKKSSRVRGPAPVQGAISLRTVAVETPKSLATLAGLKPALTAARTMLALAGGTSGSGAALRMILAVTGRGCSLTGAIAGLPSSIAEPWPIPRRRTSPSAARIRFIRSSFPS